MRTIEKPFSSNGLFNLHSNDWVVRQRKAGKIASKVLCHLKTLVENKTEYSLIELNEIAEKIIIEDKGTPTFKNYNKFPAALCMSVNNQLVHGIPTDYKLKDGDFITFDVGVTYDRAIADTAITCIYGKPKSDHHVKLLKSTEEALMKGIKAVVVGNRIGAIGNAIYKSAKKNGFNVVTNYGGHGLSSNKNGEGVLHASPFIDNKSNIDEGIRIQPGLSIAIEPLLVIGSSKNYIDNNIVYCDDICCHFEHSIYVHADYTEIITLITPS